MSVIRSAYPTLARRATTGIGGFALQNATPTILSWTPPADGQLHRVLIFASLHVTATETGGLIGVSYDLPDLANTSHTLFSASQATGSIPLPVQISVIVAAGQPVIVNQGSALTAGTATLWAEIWGS